MAFTFCSSQAMVRKAGANANSTIVASGAALADWSDEIESIICDVANNDLITKFSSLTSSGKQILQNISASHGAQQIISYDMSTYTSRFEAQTMLDVLDDDIQKGLNLIKDDKLKTYLGAT